MKCPKLSHNGITQEMSWSFLLQICGAVPRAAHPSAVRLSLEGGGERPLSHSSCRSGGFLLLAAVRKLFLEEEAKEEEEEKPVDAADDKITWI